jgi:hypothetical protein
MQHIIIFSSKVMEHLLTSIYLFHIMFYRFVCFIVAPILHLFAQYFAVSFPYCCFFVHFAYKLCIILYVPLLQSNSINVFCHIPPRSVHIHIQTTMLINTSFNIKKLCEEVIINMICVTNISII